MKRMISKLWLVPVICLLISCQGSGSKDQDGNNMNTEKSYPKTGSVIRYLPSMDQVVAPGERPEILAGGFDWSEGPVWVQELNALLFSDIPKNSIFKWSEEDSLELYLKPAGYTGTTPRGGELGSNGLLLDGQRRLVLCQHGDRRMARMEAPLDDPAPQFITLAGEWNGKRFNSPNDAAFSSTGDLYFTDPAYGMEQRYNDPAREMDFTGVFRATPEGEVTLLSDKFQFPNGIGFSPDGSTLYVANSGAGEQCYWKAFDVAEDGTLENERMFYDAHEASDTVAGGPDGFVVREDGMLFATGPGGVWVLTPEGEHLGTIVTGQPTSNCTLDADNRYLYITANMYLMRIRLL